MKAVVLLSGGIDSTTLLCDLMASGITIEALSFDYGQRHTPELAASHAVATYFGIPHMFVPLSLAKLAPTSSQTNPKIAVPHGHYADESMRTTVVPNRNMAMLALAIARAIATEADAVAFAAHQGDHAVYPDCRPEFIAAMREAAKLCDYREIELLAPFERMTKSQIVARAFELGAPLALTYSCYEGNPSHCGQCGTCVERREAFELANVPDPTRYERVSR